MKKYLYFLSILFLGCLQDNPTIIFLTEVGEIEAEIYLNEAPITSKNFLFHINENHFNGATFYRTVKTTNQPYSKSKIEVIQGGLDSLENKFLPIPHERTNKTGIKHFDGTLSMARNEPGTATTEFFICIGAQPELNFGGKRNPDGEGFAAFGKVIRGMEIVKKIQNQNDSLQRIQPPIKILSIKIKN